MSAATALLPLATSGSEDLGGLAGFAVDLMEKLGGPGAGLAVALENLFPPIPSEVILPFAGFAASRGDFTLVGAIFWTTLGSLVGAWAMYGIGAGLGRRRMYAVWARVPLVKTEDLEKTEAWFARHGGKAVFLGRMVPIFRSLISVPAGLERMSFGLFTLYTVAGSLIWNSVFVLAGYGLGEQWDTVGPYVGTFQNVVIALVVAAIGFFVVTRVRGIRAEKRAGGPTA
ncbi:membrane protein DedA, SNARE-associated domain [Nocardioides scoriae]|uniref:Membrane protein DedA, SNARE-associated domain n=1 Tax=Nocardioides scoriae TaxID=642780 RepID=A0A1H1WL36_9ACTN|nr:DedA family protein [Nocardioides scoriae]SDS97722.1 membrane protein DedA, SNARE-associated domain [Nocardioides scoriae]